MHSCSYWCLIRRILQTPYSPSFNHINVSERDMYDKQWNRGVHLVFQISCQISSTSLSSSSPSSDKENAQSEMPGSFVKKVQRIYCLILHLGIFLLVFSLSGKAYMYIQTCCNFESKSLSLNKLCTIIVIVRINNILFYCILLPIL